MGHSSRKKKKRGAAGRKAAKDHAAQHEGDQTALDEELTGPALCFLGPGAKPKLEAPNKQNLPTSLYQLQSLFRCIIKKILMVKTIAYKYIKSITGIPNPYLLNR